MIRRRKKIKKVTFKLGTLSRKFKKQFTFKNLFFPKAFLLSKAFLAFSVKWSIHCDRFYSITLTSSGYYIYIYNFPVVI